MRYLKYKANPSIKGIAKCPLVANRRAYVFQY